MLRICISGLTCSGKTSLGKELSEDLGVMHITKTITEAYRQFEKDNPKGRLERIRETSNIKYADSFENQVEGLAKENDCVVTTWIGPWRVKDPTLRIWLNSHLDQRAIRCAKRQNLSLGAAKRYVLEKDKENIKVFKKLYGINMNERSNFDIEINTRRLSRKEIVSLISMLAIGKEKKRFR
jgi:cytidylate kinase